MPPRTIARTVANLNLGVLLTAMANTQMFSKRGALGALLFASFALTIPLSNWLISNVGTVCVPDGPCLIPVAPGILAPSGVLTIGLALVLRDFIHRYLGGRWALAAIILGAGISFFTASPDLVFASVVAFMLSEILDFAVYVPLARKNLATAVLASGVVGSIVDSVVFIWLAFGSLDHVEGQIVGKLWATIIVFVLLSLKARNGRVGGTGVGV